MKKNEQISSKKQHSSRKWMYIGTVVILVVIGIAFLGGPALQFRNSSPGSFVFATYHGKDVAYRPGNFFSYAYEAYLDRMGASGINEEDTAFRIQLIWRQAYNDALLRTAAIDFAEDSNVLVSANAIDNAMIQLPRFQENDEFSMERYRNTPSQDLFMLSTLMKEDLIFQQVYQDLTETTYIASAEQEFFAAMGEEKFSFRITPFDETRYPEALIKQYFDEQQNEFQHFLLSSITFEGDREDLLEYRRQIIDGEKSFEEQARLISNDRFADQGGSRGEQFVYNLRRLYSDEIVDEYILTLEVHEVSELIEESKGTYLLFRLDGAPQTLDVEQEEDLQIVRDYILQNDFDRVESFLLEEAQAFKAEATEKGFTPTLRQYGLTAHEIEPFPLNFGNISELGTLSTEELSGISPGAFQEDFFSTLFSLEIDEISDPLLIRQVYYVAILDDIIYDAPRMHSYDDFVNTIKQNVYNEFIIKDEYLEEFFQETFDTYIRPRPVDSTDTDTATQ